MTLNMIRNTVVISHILPKATKQDSDSLSTLTHFQCHTQIKCLLAFVEMPMPPVTILSLTE